MLSRGRSTQKKFRAFLFVVLIAASLLISTSLRLYRHFFGEVQRLDVEQGIDYEVKQADRKLRDGHQRSEDDGVCSSHADSISVLPAHFSNKAQAAKGAMLLQVSSKQVLTSFVDGAFLSSPQQNASKIRSSSGRLELLAGQAPPSGDVAITVTQVVCNAPIYAPDGVCPAACPYFAQEGGASRACYFECLTAKECGSLDPKDDIADDELLICRKCKVLGCDLCAKGKGDFCAKCENGYALDPATGTCTSEYKRIWTSIFTVVGLVGVVLVAWLVRLQFLAVTNPEGLKEGLAYRSSLKLRVPRGLAPLVGADSESEERPLWPLSTNLHAVQVAGPGLTLHMNFQLAIIIWGCIVVVTWVIYTYFTSPDMLVLGLYEAETPQQLCAVTLRGKEMQKRLMPTKLIYMVIMLVCTSAFNFAYALYQRKRFLEIDDETTMTDFAAICMGLPEMTGGELVEDKVKQAIQSATGEKVVGVSVCWGYKDVEDDVMDACDREVQMLEPSPPLPDQATLDEKNSGVANKAFGYVDSLFSFSGKLPDDGSGEAQNIEDLLKSISSSDTAFIVFETEGSRDKAIEAAKKSGIEFQGNKLTLTHETCEPDTVKWTNFKVTDTEFYTKMAIGVVVIAIALLVWCFGFYAPFAMYQASYAKQGEEPGFLDALIFSMLVVAGNQIMYFLCGEVAERVGFRFSDHQEALYIGLYTLSCMINLVVDMMMEFYLAYEANIAVGSHTADGVLLQDLTGFQDIFNSYVMQRAVGNRLFAYCFPATFFIPFVMEPIFAIFFPFYICKLLLRTHPEVRGQEAEKSLNIFAPMDMGRYGDLLLNMMLAMLVVFFPPGTFLKMMLALVVSHVFVYVYDQYRILRSVPAFDYASDRIDREVQCLMGVPTAFLAGAIVFKAACLPDSGLPCPKYTTLGIWVTAAAIITMVVHVFMIKVIVPSVFTKDHKVSETPYSEASTAVSSTWFTENVVHCLRSKYIYKHNPPCLYNTRGKDYLMKANPECGSYYDGAKRVGSDEYGE
jgi:hypothetical protein